MESESNMAEKEIGISVDIIDSEDEYKAWMAYAKCDFDCAEYLNNAPLHPRPYNIICYHYQQAAEKMAKALVVYYKCLGGMAKIHDVDFQLNQIKNIVKKDKGIALAEELINMASDISIYASEPRYPNEFPADEADVIRAGKYCKAIMDWIQKVIDAPSVADK